MRTVGIDEVGRGCWAGPLVAGAVLLPPDFVVPDGAGWRLTDSKLLTPKRRQQADDAIRRAALAYGLGWVPAAELDSVGLSQALRLAMQRALAHITTAYDEIIIDGNHNFLQDVPRVRTMVKADSLVPAVSAASIIAKVARDAWMAEAGRHFPEYGFASHVGYGTRQHLDALRRHGACELHRRSYKPVQQFLSG